MSETGAVGEFPAFVFARFPLRGGPRQWLNPKENAFRLSVLKKDRHWGNGSTCDARGSLGEQSHEERSDMYTCIPSNISGTRAACGQPSLDTESASSAAAGTRSRDYARAGDIQIPHLEPKVNPGHNPKLPGVGGDRKR